MDQLTPHTVVCQCCELEWPERVTSAVRDAHLLIRGWRCRMCDEHLGDPVEMAHDHENEVRIRWGNTVDELHTAQDTADRYKAQTLAALTSRDQILQQFATLARYHRPTDYGCRMPFTPPTTPVGGPFTRRVDPRNALPPLRN